MFSHLDEKGALSMVDVTEKTVSLRTAVTSGEILLSPSTLEKISLNSVAKGSVLEAARAGGFLGAKHLPFVVPLTHTLTVEHIKISFRFLPDRIVAFVLVRTHGRTGVEMEALFSLLSSLATVYDMVKAFDKGAAIVNFRLLLKEGGKSGLFTNFSKEEGLTLKSEAGLSHLLSQGEEVLSW